MMETRTKRTYSAASLALLLTGVGLAYPWFAGGASVPPGSLDAGFDPGVGVDQSVFFIAVQPDRKVIVAGDFTSVDGASRRGIARLNSDGSLDPSFDPESGANDLVGTVAIQTNGQVLLGGYFTEFNGATRSYMARLNFDGTLDAGFAAEVDAPVLAVALDRADRVLIGGTFTNVNGTTRHHIARLKSDGTLDTSFDPSSGVAGEDFSTVNSAAIQTDGKIVIGGHFTSVNGLPRSHVARLNDDGSLDVSFQAHIDVAGAGFLSGVYAVALQTDGKVLIAGDFTGVDGVARTNIARLNANGSLDTSFDAGTGTDLAVNTVAVQSNGKVLIGGFFTRANGAVRNYIARLNAGGSLDADFDPASGTDDAVYAVSLQSDGQVLVGGFFTRVNGTPRNGIARLNGDTVIPAPRLFSPVRHDSTFSISVATVPGSSYVLEFKDALEDSAWSARPAVNGDGAAKTLTDPGASGSRRFYRVRVQ